MIDLEKILELESKATPYFMGGYIPANCKHERNPNLDYSEDWISLGTRVRTCDQAKIDTDFIREVRSNIRQICLELQAAREVLIHLNNIMYCTGPELKSALKQYEEVTNGKG
mgnify:CR=1 FL=1